MWPYKLKTFLLSLTIVFLFQTWMGIEPLFGGNKVLMEDISPKQSNNPAKTDESIGYKGVVRCYDGFVAAGSGGRIDWIADSGKILGSEKIHEENFNCLLSKDNDVFVAGDHGAMFVSSEKGTFRKVNSGTDKNINSLAHFKSKIIGGTDDGEILSGDGSGSFSKIHLDIRGNIVSVSARNGDCYGVTNEGEIIHTTDGVNWEIFDFNRIYKGFYKPCTFTSILATEKGIAVAGVYTDGSPAFMLSSLGNVWSERALVYNDEQGIQELLTDQPRAIYYDDSHDLFYLACNAGKLMKLPSCSHCNELAEISVNTLAGISGTYEMLMIVGEGFYIKTLIY